MSYTHYVCLKIVFLVQFEKHTKGWQLLDEQHVLFKAKSKEEAEEQLKQYCEQVSKPYKNSDKIWVRWKFDHILDSYETDLPGEADFGETGGMEVFSSFRNRRRKPDDYWDGV